MNTLSKAVIATTLLASSGTVAAEMCEEAGYTATLGSVHLLQNPDSTVHFNGINPGLGTECDRWQAGVYYNSIKKVTVYVGRIAPANQYFGVKYGLATGYDYPIVPYVAGYVRPTEHTELTVIPKTRYTPLVIALSLRW